MKLSLTFCLHLFIQILYSQSREFIVNDLYKLQVDSIGPLEFKLYLICNAGNKEYIGLLNRPIRELLSIYFHESSGHIKKREITLLYYKKYTLNYFSAFQILSINGPFLENHKRNINQWHVTNEDDHIFTFSRGSGFRILDSVEWINRTTFILNFRRYMQYDNYRLLVIENNGKLVSLENCEPGWLLMNRKENQAK